MITIHSILTYKHSGSAHEKWITEVNNHMGQDRRDDEHVEMNAYNRLVVTQMALQPDVII